MTVWDVADSNKFGACISLFGAISVALCAWSLVDSTDMEAVLTIMVPFITYGPLNNFVMGY